mmetsp:Transcript_13421/g.27412  ORF Transcript_13421/g.27412 Transcript_13421/m.27412 type:complete len:135 (+) Transcript_13421:555-959(+)
MKRAKITAMISAKTLNLRRNKMFRSNLVVGKLSQRVRQPSVVEVHTQRKMRERHLRKSHRWGRLKYFCKCGNYSWSGEIQYWGNNRIHLKICVGVRKRNEKRNPSNTTILHCDRNPRDEQLWATGLTITKYLFL